MVLFRWQLQGEGLRFLSGCFMAPYFPGVYGALLICGIILGDLWTLKKLTSFQCFRHFAFLQQTLFQYNQWRFLPLAWEGSAVWLYSKINVRINGQKKKSTVRLGRGLQPLAQRQSHRQGAFLTDQPGGGGTLGTTHSQAAGRGLRHTLIK